MKLLSYASPYYRRRYGSHKLPWYSPQAQGQIMNTVYEALRTLLRNKELEIKKLEKEIEALRIVLPIVAEAGEAGVEAIPTFDSPRPTVDAAKTKAPIPGPDFDNMMAQVKAAQASTSPAPAQSRPNQQPDNSPPKPRASWP
jgi:hypothetical protein